MAAPRRTALTGLLASALAGCAPAPQPPAAERLDCDDGRARSVIFDAAADTAVLVEGAGRRVLAHLVSGSGARYGAGRVELWIKGREATLSEGETRRTCRFEG